MERTERDHEERAATFQIETGWHLLKEKSKIHDFVHNWRRHEDLDDLGEVLSLEWPHLNGYVIWNCLLAGVKGLDSRKEKKIVRNEAGGLTEASYR